jgi:hypothetical protein
MSTFRGVTDGFPITIGLHQRSTLLPFLFTVVMDELTRHIQAEVLWCKLFFDDIVLVDETRECINAKLKLWRDTQEAE